MQIDLIAKKNWTGRVLVGFMFEGDKTPLAIPGDEGKSYAAVAAGEKFTGQFKKTSLLRSASADYADDADSRLGPARAQTAETKEWKLILTGLGKRKEFELDRVRSATAKALKRAEEIGAESVGLLVPDSKEVRGDLADFAAAAVEGAILSSYRFDKYRTPKADEDRPVGELTLVFANTKNLSVAMRKAVDEVVARSEAVCFTRDLANEPPSPKPPEKMAEIATGLAKKGRITVEVMHKAELEKLGMGGILRVGAGSHQPPCLVHLTYTPAGKSKQTVVVIGKGITFDSGGISIKPSAGMEAMKDDMAGAGAVLGLFKWLGSVDVPVTVHGLAPFAENMPGGGAQKPGDVIRHYNGKTAEVISTDAEGRHLLADCLAYGSTLKPDLMIDIATLTGACVVALGDEYSALLGTDQRTIARLISVGRQQGEFFWELPLPDRYKSHLKSKVADMKHVGKPGIAGTITAGLFLKEFVGEGVPWVHIDIAGPSFTKEDWDYAPSGATGVPLRTIAALLRGL
ncbi:MAG: leucyl aminopeptidase [candidate division WOR-3 bacterium]|nr:leucyl aminopeptidase [candidate division WOR-3 bacterium]